MRRLPHNTVHGVLPARWNRTGRERSKEVLSSRPRLLSSAARIETVWVCIGITRLAVQALGARSEPHILQRQAAHWQRP